MRTFIGEVNLFHFPLSFAVILALVTAEARAAELTITNHSFENPVLSDGGGSFSTPGWTQQGPPGTLAIYNPNNTFFSNTTDGTPGNPLNGLNAVAINIGSKLSYQTTNPVSPQVVYSLTFLAGYRFASPFGNSSVSLWAGTNLLAERIPNPTEGTFMPFSLIYTSPPSGLGIGMPLRIELKAVGTDSQAWFDNFHLFADPSVCTPHRATATAQLVNGVFVGATITDPGCGYTNTPPVVIQGGGGNGAAATAVVSNGIVVAIQVNNGGCCYTNAPTIEIGSPPFVPTVAIRVSRVIVTQNVVLGRRYVLESSSDLVSWTPTGPSFTATSETVESEFQVGLTGRFFRLREVP
jgi:hypothetical protein